MTWPWDARGFPRRDRIDGRRVRSFLVAEGVPMPSTGDVMVFGPVGPIAALFASPSSPLACRVEGVQGRTVWYVPYGSEVDADDLLGASRWKMRRVRTGPRRYEEVASRV